jgi:hypothetical protein
MALEWFDQISYTYNMFTQQLICYKFNYFTQNFDVVAEAVCPRSEINYPEGVKDKLGFTITREDCAFHQMCYKFYLKKDNEIIDTICKRHYLLNIKLI